MGVPAHSARLARYLLRVSSLRALALLYDIRGFTAASKRLGTADLGAYATGAHRLVLDLFAARPAAFVKNLGDGHLLLWPVEGDLPPDLAAFVVERACAVGPAFRAWVDRQRESGVSLPSRVGVGAAFGEVSRSDDYYGRAINLASRLQHLARPEGVALSEEVHAAALPRVPGLAGRFRRAKERLKGLGRVPVRLARPFSLGRLLRRLGLWVGVWAVPLAYLLLCDAGVGLPGSARVRDALDEREFFLLRPAPSPEACAHALPPQRRRLVGMLLDLRMENGLFRNAFGGAASETTDVWSTMQAAAALLRAPELGVEDAARLRPTLEAPFRDGRYIERDGVAYGWLAHAETPFTEAEPALWTVAALALAYRRAGLLDEGGRRRLLEHLAMAQRAALTYRPLETGGWNIFPRQKDPARHSPYSTALALLALLELKAAGLGWLGDEARREEMLRATANFLIERFEPGPGPGTPGWRRTNDRNDKISAGLTMQILAELLRAEVEAGVDLPAPLLAAVPGLLGRLEDASLSDAYDMGEFTVAFTNHDGLEDGRTEGINFLWHPWAIECAARWLERAARLGAPTIERVRVRRALARWTIEDGQRAVEAASDGYCFVASETLYGYSALEVR